MAKILDKETLPLMDTQGDILGDMFYSIKKMKEEGKPGAILAQIYPTRIEVSLVDTDFVKKFQKIQEVNNGN